jgi:hypothetical protein
VEELALRRSVGRTARPRTLDAVCSVRRAAPWATTERRAAKGHGRMAPLKTDVLRFQYRKTRRHRTFHLARQSDAVETRYHAGWSSCLFTED